MKNTLYFYLITFYAFAVIMVSPVYAYLDPGSASLVLQAIVGSIAAASLTIGLYWKKVKEVTKRIFSKKSQSEE